MHGSISAVSIEPRGAAVEPLLRPGKLGDINFLGETLPGDFVAELTLGGKLTAAKVRSAKPGNHGDGRGLYLQVIKSSRSWIFRYKEPLRSIGDDAASTAGQGAAAFKHYEIGLGSAADISLAEARARATICRRLVAKGVNLKARKREISAAVARPADVTFRDAAARFIKARAPGWKGEKSEEVWTNSLATYALPTMGDLPVHRVETSHVMGVLEQEVAGGASFWAAMPETANRVRGRIEAVLDWAKVRGYRTGENPARWKGHVEHMLPGVKRVRAVAHYAALPYREMNAFWRTLEGRGGVAAECLRFTILTAARSGEAMGAKWSEIDLETRVWIIPADRMKAKKEHRVPLSDAALKVLTTLHELRRGDTPFVFPGAKKGRPLSGTALIMLMRNMGRGDLTVHGFRSSFRDWAAEQTSYAAEAVELSLAHAINSKVEAAYRRGDMFDRRRRLMADWAAFIESAPATADNVTAIRGGGNG